MNARPTEFGKLSRRHLLVGSGLALSAVGLAACSGEEAPDPFAGNSEAASGQLESQMLADLVEAGDLPPLEERLPKNPMVVEPFGEIGVHGGTLARGTTNGGQNAAHISFASAALLEWDRDGQSAIPSVAETFEKNGDNTEFTLTIREGMKWSDGEPFTIEDLKFAVDSIALNTTLAPVPPVWIANTDGTAADVSFPDDRTMILKFNEPFALWEKYMCHPTWVRVVLRPKHYLEQFHPDHNPDAEKLAKDAGYDTWDQYFVDRWEPWTNPEIPVLGAYVVKTPVSQGGNGLMERNPYYWKVDPEGKQLPYIDQIQIQELGQETLDLRAANGDFHFQGNEINYNSSAVLIENAEANNFEVRRWTPDNGLVCFYLNLSHDDEATRELFQQKDFRVALSIAIDREDLNTTLLGGLGEIAQKLPSERSDYFLGEGVGQDHLEFDVDAANELLDGLGLEKGSDGIRVTAAGDKLSYVVIARPNPAGVAIPDLVLRVKEYWKAIGVEISYNEMDPSLYATTYTSNDFDIDVSWLGNFDDFDMEPVFYVPTNSGSHTAPAYGQWVATNGAEGIEPTDEFKQLVEYWDELRTSTSDEERIEAGKKIAQQHADNLYLIGTIAPAFQPVVVSNDVRNVRDDDPVLSHFYLREGITKPEQVFFAQ